MRKNNKWKYLAVCLVALLGVGVLLTGCGDGFDDIDDKDRVSTPAVLTAPIKIAALKGPTGMGLTYLMQEPEKYEVTLYQSPDEAVSKLLSGDVDIAAVASNLGSVLYNKNQGDICVLAVNTGGISYIVENGAKTIMSLQDLRGKTLIASGKGSTPEYMLNRLLLNAGLNPASDVSIQWVGNHSDAAAAFLAQPGAIAMLPEPFVSMAEGKSTGVTVSIDLDDLWEDAYDEELPMGIFIAKKSFVQERAGDLAIFMADADRSADRVGDMPEEAAELIAKNGIVDSAAIALQAIPRCNIMFESGQDAKEMLRTLYGILMEMEPAAIGGAIPADDFYYMYTVPDVED